MNRTIEQPPPFSGYMTLTDSTLFELITSIEEFTQVPWPLDLETLNPPHLKNRVTLLCEYTIRIMDTREGLKNLRNGQPSIEACPGFQSLEEEYTVLMRDFESAFGRGFPVDVIVDEATFVQHEGQVAEQLGELEFSSYETRSSSPFSATSSLPASTRASSPASSISTTLSFSQRIMSLGAGFERFWEDASDEEKVAYLSQDMMDLLQDNARKKFFRDHFYNLPLTESHERSYKLHMKITLEEKFSNYWRNVSADEILELLDGTDMLGHLKALARREFFRRA
ncbi:hypothetical protein NHQ30_000890 [Ciborinia camelliae]|nr:hypothetical protein NHQ30_000890 [Ciborinia camelliae]